MFIAILLILAMLTGCATSGTSRINGDQSMENRLGSALVSPLSDLNIVQVTIPPVVSEALKNPYQIPEDASCTALAEQIQKLDEALGSDLDATGLAHEKTISEKGGEFIQNEAIGSVERTISGFIPFRSWIRKFSGAEKRSKELTAAIAAGVVRRAFLKGIGQQGGCPPPAAPIIPPPATDPASASAPETPEVINLPPPPLKQRPIMPFF